MTHARSRLVHTGAQQLLGLFSSLPSINSDWQRVLERSYQSNGNFRTASDGVDGSRTF